MKKIVFLVERLVNNGPENVVLDICRYMDRTKYLPVIFTLRSGDFKDSIESKFTEMDVEIRHFNFSMLDQELKTKRIAKIIEKKFKEANGDVLHAHCYQPQLLASYMKDIPTVSTIHNISGEDFVMKKGVLMGLYMTWRFNRSLSKIRCGVAISDYMMEYYAGKCQFLKKITNGVSFRLDENIDHQSVKKKLHIQENVPVISVIGGISERKNVLFVVEELKKNEFPFVCLIVGNGDKMDECVNVTQGDTRFRYEGFQNNVAEYLSVSDFYISASKSEGLPLSVLEALNMGVPCLLSNIRPHKEIVGHMDVDGVECFALEKGALTEKCSFYANKKFDKKKIANQANAIYGAEVMAREYEQLYALI